MIVEIGGTRYEGRIVDLRERAVDRAALAAALRGEPSPYVVDCPTPGPVHDRAGVVAPDAGLKARTALAAAARSRGVETPHDDRIEALVDDLAAVGEAIAANRQGTDRESASAEGPEPGDLASLRERAAELRGRIDALQDVDVDPTEARAKLRETATRLSELETERIAADQVHERTREQRDRRERRLRLEDRLANARRDARAALVDAVREEYADAVAAVLAARDGEGALGEDAPAPVAGVREAPDDPFAVPGPVASLAVLRVAEVSAPVILAVEGVGPPAAVAAWLDAPVLAP